MRRLLLVPVLVLAAGCSIAGTATPAAAPAPTTAATSPSSGSPASPTARAATGRTITFEASGSGTAYTIDYGPTPSGTNERELSPTLPWTQQVPDTDAEIYQVVVVGGNDVGCTITIAGEVVAQEPAGGSAHCVYRR